MVDGPLKVKAPQYSLIFIGLGLFEIAAEESKCHCKGLEHSDVEVGFDFYPDKKTQDA